MSAASRATQILRAASEGDPKAAADLLPLVYAELRRLARIRMADLPPGNTLQPTALVHEAYVRLIDSGEHNWNSRGHFFSAAAEAMRRILVEQARRKASRKRGGDRRRVDAGEFEIPVAPPADDILALDDALEMLRREDPRKAQIVMYRYFAGLDRAETASALGVSVSTVDREWRYIRVRLYRALRPKGSG